MGQGGWALVVIALVGLWLWWDYRRLPPERRATIATESRALRELRRDPPVLSQVGARSSTGLLCPRCNGAQFKARRTGRARAGIVLGGLMAAAVLPQDRVQCVTCGAVYRRG